jgi:oligopeptide/dipeptide ABC transporter ATP-binding protein
VDGVDLDLPAGTVTALVGESGSGKTLTALALLGLVPPPARLVSGTVALEGRDLGALPPREQRRVRGARIALVPQDPAAALDPVVRVGAQVAEVLRVHGGLGRAAARSAATSALAEVGVVRDDHPHRLSGGQRQRALIAMALAPGPQVLIADEPTASLDATVQVAVLDLIARRRAELGLTVLLITHDLGSVARLADRVAVMYAGRIVEEGPARPVLSAPRHPYTAGLLELAPRLGAGTGPRVPIAGAPPVPGAMPPGCPFSPRCPARRRECDAARPELRPAGPGRRVACILEEAEAAALRRGPA